jgi:hypothetical protein
MSTDLYKPQTEGLLILDAERGHENSSRVPSLSTASRSAAPEHYAYRCFRVHDPADATLTVFEGSHGEIRDI